MASAHAPRRPRVRATAERVAGRPDRRRRRCRRAARRACGPTAAVIGVPIAATPLGGMDALLSIVQMPKGVPVATVAIGSWGAANAGILAAQILAVGDAALRQRLVAYRERLAGEVEERARRVADKLKSRG